MQVQNKTTTTTTTCRGGDDHTVALLGRISPSGFHTAYREATVERFAGALRQTLSNQEA